MPLQTVTIPIPGTKNLQPPDLVVVAELDPGGIGGEELAFLSFYEDYWNKNYMKGLKPLLDKQVAALAVPLKSMQKTCDDLLQLKAAMDSVGLDGKALKLLEPRVGLLKDLENEIEQYPTYLAGAVENIRKQQILIYNQTFMKQAQKALAKKVKSELFWKKVRSVVTLTIKGTLLVAGAVVGVMAVVALASVNPPAGAVLAYVAGKLVLNKLCSGIKFIKELRDNWNLEEKAIKDVMADLDAIEEHLGVKTQNATAGLAKHLSVASKYLSLQRIKADGLKKEMAELRTKIAYQENLLKAIPTNSGMPKVVAEAKAATAAIAGLKSKLDKSTSAWDKESAKIDRIEKLFEETNTLLGELGKVPYQKPKSLSQRLKEAWDNKLDSLASLAETVDEFADIG